MQRTRIIETEISTATSAGAATSIGNATCVRLHNDTSGIATIAISASVGAATTNYFTMPGNTVEFLEKLPTDVIWTTPAIKATKVGFTN
jgi:hypothetical protein